MGHVDPISFSRGKRGIAGTMISLLLDTHLLNGFAPFTNSKFVADKDEIVPDATFKTVAGLSSGAGTATAPKNTAENVSDMYEAKAPWYVDQILPFDVSIIAANEYGQASAMRLYACEILNEGSGFSIDDIVIENQMTYVCRSIVPWRKIGEWTATGGGNKEVTDLKWGTVGADSQPQTHGGTD